jgi:hypothetical protein
MNKETRPYVSQTATFREVFCSVPTVAPILKTFENFTYVVVLECEFADFLQGLKAQEKLCDRRRHFKLSKPSQPYAFT